MKYAYTRTFTETGDFSAVRAAEAWLEGLGFSIGATERGSPRGLLYGDWSIQKWRNMTRQQRADLHGTMDGGRDGPVTVRLSATMPDEALMRVMDDGMAVLAGAA